MTGAEAQIANGLNSDPAFMAEGITVRTVRFGTGGLLGKVIVIFNTPFENDRVAIIDEPTGAYFLRSVENLLFLKIMSKVASPNGIGL